MKVAGQYGLRQAGAGRYLVAPSVCAMKLQIKDRYYLPLPYDSVARSLQQHPTSAPCARSPGITSRERSRLRCVSAPALALDIRM